MSIDMKIPSGSDRNVTYQEKSEVYANKAKANIFKSGYTTNPIVETVVEQELNVRPELLAGFESSRNHFTGSKVLDAPEAVAHSGKRNSVFSDSYSLSEGVKWDSDEDGKHTLKRKYDANGNVVTDKTTPVVAHEYHNKDWGVKHGILHIDPKTGQAAKGGTPYHYEAEDQEDVIAHIRNAFGAKTESVDVEDITEGEKHTTMKKANASVERVAQGYNSLPNSVPGTGKKISKNWKGGINKHPLDNETTNAVNFPEKTAAAAKFKAGYKVAKVSEEVVDEGFVNPAAAKKAKDDEDARKAAKDLQDEGGMPSARLGKNDAQYKVKPITKGVLVKGKGYGDNMAATPEKGDSKSIGEPFSFAALSKAFGVQPVTHATPGGRRRITGKDTVDDSNDGDDYNSENQHKDAEAAHAPGTNQQAPDAKSPDMADKLHARLHGATRNTLAVEFIRTALAKGMQPMSILAMANSAVGRRNLRAMKEDIELSVQMFSEDNIMKYEVSHNGNVISEGYGHNLVSAAKSALTACELAEEKIALEEEQHFRIKSAIKQITA